MTDAPPRPPSQRLLWLGVGAAAILAIAGGVAFTLASRSASSAATTTADAVMTIVSQGCTPNEISVEGGRRSFEIVNQSDRPIEWEILDGVLVVAERENIAPGFRQTLSVDLRPGDYEMGCGLLSNPRGILHVTASDEASHAAGQVTIRRFLGPLSEYRVSALMGAARAVSTARTLRDAISNDDLAAAQTAWMAARLPYRQIEPIAHRISDVENRIDPQASYLAGHEADPAFSGYHRLEYGLFATKSTQGLLPIADALVTDLETLQARLKDLEVDPNLLISMPADMARLLAETQVLAGENPYAQTDIAEFGASAAALRKLKTLFDPLLQDIDPELSTRLAGNIDAVDAELATLSANDGSAAYDTVSDAQRQKLADRFSALADTFGQLPDALGQI